MANVMASAFHILHMKAVQERAEQSTANQTIDNLLAAVEWQLLCHDPGEEDAFAEANEQQEQRSRPATREGGTRTNALGGHAVTNLVRTEKRGQLWTAEPEPAPCPVDCWARGVLSVKARQDAKFVGTAHSLQPLAAAPPQSSQGRRPVTGSQSRAVSREAASRISSARGHSGTKHEKDETQLIRDLAVTKAVPITIPKAKLELMRKREALREAELKDMKQKKNSQRRATEKVQQDAEESKRMNMLQSTLKGKQFTVDGSGDLILIRPMKAADLPSGALEPRVRVARDAVAPVKRSTRARSSAVKETKSKGKREKRLPASAFVDLSSAQPSLIDTVQLQEGVTIKQAGNSRSNAKQRTLDNAQQLTRTEYNNLLNVMGIAMDTQKLGGSNNDLVAFQNNPSARGTGLGLEKTFVQEEKYDNESLDSASPRRSARGSVSDSARIRRSSAKNSGKLPALKGSQQAQAV